MIAVCTGGNEYKLDLAFHKHREILCEIYTDITRTVCRRPARRSNRLNERCMGTL